MENKHLIWMIPICLVIGSIVGFLVASAGLGRIAMNYPIVNCVINMEDSLNIDGNKLPFTKESQREAVEWRCAKEFVDFNITDYEEIFEEYCKSKFEGENAK